MITLLILTIAILIALIPSSANAQSQQTGSVLVSTSPTTFGWLKQFQGWGITKDSNSTSVTYKVDTGVVMSVQRAADSITSLKATVALKLASSGFNKAAMVALGMMAYTDSAAMLSPYLRSNVAAATYQPVGTYATASSSTAFTNKTGSNSQWTNDAGYITSSSLSGYVPTSRTISTTSPLSGGGDLSANRTFAIANSKADNSTLGAASFDSVYFNDNGSGLISYGVNYGTGSVSAGAVTINHPRGKITYTSPSITAGTAIAVTFTNSFINATSTINIGLNGNGSNLTLVNAYVKSQTAGSCVINIQNLSLLSLFNSTLIIDYFIVN